MEGKSCSLERLPFLILTALYSIPLQIGVCVLAYWASLHAGGFTADELKAAKPQLEAGLEDPLVKEDAMPPV